MICKFIILILSIKNTTIVQGNPACKQIPWDDDESKYLAFKEGRTGYPYIDAIMVQLRTEGTVSERHILM